MKFSTNNYRKYVAAAAAAFAAIVMPVQAADCTTMCKDRAHQAGYAAAMQAHTRPWQEMKKTSASKAERCSADTWDLNSMPALIVPIGDSPCNPYARDHERGSGLLSSAIGSHAVF